MGPQVLWQPVNKCIFICTHVQIYINTYTHLDMYIQMYINLKEWVSLHPFQNTQPKAKKLILFNEVMIFYFR
jgi:hypothetical protein